MSADSDPDDRGDSSGPSVPGRESKPMEPLLGEFLTDAVRRLVRRGRAELGKAARSGRTRLEQRQLQRDLDHFWARLGKTAYRLVEAGEIDHPSLRKAMERIVELEGELDAARGGGPDRSEGTPPRSH